MHNINKEIQIPPDKQGCADYYIKISLSISQSTRDHQSDCITSNCRIPKFYQFSIYLI